MATFEVTRDGTTLENAVYDVDPVTVTSNPFGNFSVAKIDDQGGEKFAEYGRGTRIDVNIQDEAVETAESFTNADTGATGTAVDVSAQTQVTVELVGAGGGDSQGSTTGVGGNGGRLEVQIDVVDIDELTVYAGEAGATPAAGVGLYDGGDGVTNVGDLQDAVSGGGASVTALVDTTGSNTTELAIADGGGGAAARSDLGGTAGVASVGRERLQATMQKGLVLVVMGETLGCSVSTTATPAVSKSLIVA